MIGGWFVAGTDTGVGKTQVSVALLGAIAGGSRRAVGMKPIASGCRRTVAGLRSEDAERLQAAGSVAADYDRINPYAFEPPVAPQLAAACAGVEIRPDVIREQFRGLAEAADWVVVEGVGGWRAPIARGRDMNEIARLLDLPVILVAAMRLGCINHALLTVDSILADGCRLAGWVANQVDPAFDADGSIEVLRERIPTPLLATIGHNPSHDAWLTHGAAMASHLLTVT